MDAGFFPSVDVLNFTLYPSLRFVCQQALEPCNRIGDYSSKCASIVVVFEICPSCAIVLPSSIVDESRSCSDMKVQAVLEHRGRGRLKGRPISVSVG